MAIKVEIMPRVFKFKDQELPDPNPKMSEKEVIEHYSNQHSELVSGFVESTEMAEGKMIVKIRTALGTKG